MSQGPLRPGCQMRTCASCGRRAMFHLEPDVGWARCSECRRYA
jgi:hypothetical protein